MSWVVRLPLGPVKFPPRCAACFRGKDDLPETVQHYQEKWSVPLGHIHFTKYLVYDVQVPICVDCRRGRRRMQILVGSAFAGFGVPLLWLPFLDPKTIATSQGSALIAFSLISLLVAGAAEVLVLWKGRAFRIAKVIGGEVTYALSSKAYAEEFGLMNGVGTEFQLYAGRLPFSGPTT